MSEIHAADLVEVSLAASEAHSCEIRAAAVGSYEIRSANLGKVNLAASEVDS
jgi:hypothetical protein